MNDQSENNTDTLSEKEPVIESNNDIEAKSENAPNKEIIIKKSGLAAFGLLLSLGAIGLSGFQYWQSLNTETVQVKDWSQDISQLTDQQTRLSQTINQSIKQTQSDIESLKNSSFVQEPGTPRQETIDYQPQIDQLLQQIDAQNQQLAQLQRQLKSQSKDTAPNKLKLPEPEPMDDRRWAIDTLYGCRLLLNQGQTDQAITSLQGMLNQAQLNSGHRQTLNQLLNDWQSIKVPNTNQWQAELNDIRDQVRALQLPASSQDQDSSENTAWYDRFISVKKIESDDQLPDSHALMLVKSETINHLQQANWALALSQQLEWQQHLERAAELLPKHANALKQQMNQLAKTNITPQGFDLTALDAAIEQLKGNR